MSNVGRWPARATRTSCLAMSVASRAEIDAQVLIERRRDPLLFVCRARATSSGRSSIGPASVSNDSPVSSRSSSLRGSQCALRLNDGRSRLIVRSARFLHVGDGDQADLEALVRLLELARERFERRLRGVDGVLRGEHVEVALRRALNQILLRGLVVGFRLRDLRSRHAAGSPIDPSGTASAAVSMSYCRRLVVAVAC